MISEFSKNLIGSDYVVGDIHGCFSRLKSDLDSIGFNPEKDRLFSVGDLVDRGPESIDVTDWIGNGWFFPVRGNHDDFAIRHAKIGNLNYENYARNGGAWFMALPKDEQQKIADCLETLPLAISVETDSGLIGIVHADIPTSTWSELREILTSNASRGKLKIYTDYLMWSRDRAQSKNDFVISDLQSLIVGHTPVINPMQLGNVRYIDTMGWRDGGGFTLVKIQ